MSLMTWGGTILEVGGMLAESQACCCETPCCDPRPADTLHVTLSNVSDCGCIDAVTFDIVWDEVNQWWEGSPGLAGCALLMETFRLRCDTSRTLAEGESPCLKYIFTIVGVTSCLPVNEYPYECQCDPFVAQFDITIKGGIGCCDSMAGSGHIGVSITE